MTDARVRRSASAVHRRQLRFAAGAALLIAALVYVAFVKDVPLRGHFEVRGTVSTASQLRPGNPVRIAGLDVGRVESIEPGPGGKSTIRMRIDKHSSLRSDASFAIEPRLFLDGNQYVALRPGTPGAPRMRSGSTIPSSHTSAPVQLDQVLSVLTPATRNSLKSSFREIGTGLGHGSPEPAAARATTGAKGLSRASRELARALPSFTRVAAAARGTQDGDLRRAVSSGSDVAAQFGRDPERLAALVTDFDRVVSVLARNDTQLRASLRSLDKVVTAAPRQLATISAALPSIRRFAAVARPALQAAPGPLRDTDRALAQLGALSSPGELPLAVSRLRPVTRSLPVLEERLTTLFPLLTAVSECTSRNIVPTLNKELPDGKLSSGRPAWQDLLHMAAALTGTSPGFDGNGGTLRISLAEGANAMRSNLPGLGPLVSAANIEGVNPRWLGYGVAPTFRPDQPCTDQKLPDLGARRTAGLPSGFEAIPKPKLNRSQAGRKLDILQLLYGSSADRRKLLRKLLGELPKAKRPAKDRPARAPQGGRPVLQKPSRPDLLRPLKPAPEAKSPLQEATDVVSDILGRLLGPLGVKGGGR